MREPRSLSLAALIDRDLHELSENLKYKSLEGIGRISLFRSHISGFGLSSLRSFDKGTIHDPRANILFEPLVETVTDKPAGETAPPPRSPVIKELRWAPPETIVRRAKGSDN